ncbi:uncharacterized protein LOC134670379 isoform X2 [Cydia fagiglandana]|uniref:uncharacterized protein LOC134670379 isoform X2 n=1 Tax=Cydia fagiglandana TaxID=1458189 RepID=UPI002FEE0797
MPPGKPGLVIKRHNIRIWCHDCDMARLQRVVWEGHGARLLSEVSNQPVVKKFLEAVPYLMNTIRDIHEAVIQNDLEGLIKHSGEPVTSQILSSRDANNMTVMHKAAGLGHGGILKYIAFRYPQGINDVDNDGRTPLHYAAIVRDEQHMYNTLVGLGADESVVDNKNKTPGYYINRPQEIDKNILKTLPDAPRTPSSTYPSSWDWKILDTEVIAELNKKSRRKMKASSENISSKNNTTTISETIENKAGGMKNSSTHEFIKDLPDLDDNVKPNHNNGDTNDSKLEDSQIAEETDDVTENYTEDEEKEKPEEEKAEEAPVEENANDVEDDHNNEEHKNENGKYHENDEHETKNGENETNHKQEENDEKHQEDEKNEPETQNAENTDDKTEAIEQVPDAVESREEVKDTEKAEIDEITHNASKDHESHDASENHEPHDHEHSEQNEVDETKPANQEEKTEIKDEEHDFAVENHEEHNGESQVDKHGEMTHKNNDIHENTKDTGNKSEEEVIESPKEGNNKYDHNEDDDDVQVQGDAVSEYSETNLRSTAELSDTNSAKRGNLTDGRSTQDSLIEGIVNGEAELDSQDASITQRDGSVHGDGLAVDNEIDPEVTELINNANMEMLAALVLNGEGSRLVGRRSGNSELQAFLDNVSTYMQKINKVHLAAREGNIRELQAALDRRKFAIARDSISPNGATPLHVATVFGKTNIIKYLGGRFPETLSAVDFEGRTALHYAAVLPDNGHYYNLLQQLGANAKDLDDNGRSAEEYYKTPSLLPFSQLIADFGIDEETAKEMLSDKGTDHVANGHMDIPIFRTDEGRYLAKSLGDPLIKGLTEVANVKPKDPVAFLASFLHNFPENEKPRLVTQGPPEVENEQPPPDTHAALSRSATRTATRPRPIDVITVDPRAESSPDGPEAAFSSADRDEHGQSMLHFAAARTHTRNALFQLLQESDVNLAYRDELYRTARDVSLQANVPENTAEIDRWVLHLAARGNKEKIMELFLEGYDHILDVVDDEGVPITDVVASRDSEMSNVLASIPAFEDSRDALHSAIRRGDLAAVENTLAAEGGRTLARGKSSFGRTALHVAVLAQHEEIVALLASKCPELLRFGDNLERTPLHYAMGVEKMESLSRVLIRAGAKRVLKDLKGRQPSYYFMNKSDILRLKEEEEIY